MRHFVTTALALTVPLLLLEGSIRRPQLEGQADDIGNLEPAFAYAVDQIRARQNEDGYWTTAYTKVTQFDNWRLQIDVWTPAILIDLLAPVAEETGLRKELEQVREYPRNQIEPTGLVLYNRQDTQLVPDADDTALIWRIAPKDDSQLLRKALATLRQYRTGDGLYRIWLAPGGIPNHPAVGDDPNPIDMMTQIHVYLFLAKYSSVAAKRLCEAIRKHIDQQAFWTYNEITPGIFPMREVDLYEGGCQVTSPHDELTSEIRGQDFYQKLMRLTRDLLVKENPRDLRAAILRTLTQLAEDEFALAEKTPIFLYHNDLTGAVPRFYWSKEVTYALWLRLYVEARRRLGEPTPSR